LSTTIACIQGAHAIAAHFAGPHWLVNDADAKTYAAAINNVARHYDVGAAQKTIDILNLCGMVAFIEGTRLLYSRSPASRPQPPQASAPVVPLFRFATPPAAMGQAPRPPTTPASEVFGPPLPSEAEPLPEGPVH
jgi:hypothetical protein